jgi:tRNA (cytidine/uridine-2'-O-)-methyltransferase
VPAHRAQRSISGVRRPMRDGRFPRRRIGLGCPPPKYQPLLHVVLVAPEIPHNTGSVGRTCVAAGCKLWLVRPLGFRLDDYYLRRAGLDYWEHLEWEVADDWQALCGRLPAREPWLFSKTASASYLDARYAAGDVLVFGNESQGLPRRLLESAGSRLRRIPVRPQARSLNLSNAVGIVTFEALRQLGGPEVRQGGHGS